MKHTKNPEQNEIVAANAVSAGGDVAMNEDVSDQAVPAPEAGAESAPLIENGDGGVSPDAPLSEPDVREAFLETELLPRADASDAEAASESGEAASAGETDLFEADEDDVDESPIAEDDSAAFADDAPDANDDDAHEDIPSLFDDDTDKEQALPERPRKKRSSDGGNGRGKKRPAQKSKAYHPKDDGETNLRIIRIFLVAGVLLAIALVVVMVMLNREGQQADAYASQLLDAYENQPAAQSTEAPTEAPAATDTPAPTDAPEPTVQLDEYGEPIEVTPTPEPVEETSDEADAQAMADADEHALDDGSHENVDEGADYVQPEAPEADEAEQIIAEVVNKVGEDGIIGIITIPEADVRLPIIGKWSYGLLKISVCRYKGPAVNSKGNLVVIGHNYRSGAHFGNLDELSEGSAVYLTDANSNKVRYEVYDMVTISPDAFSSLNSYKGECGLTLMTCKNQGQNRLLVRCVQKDAEIPQPR